MALIVISNVFASGGGGGGINSIGSSDGTIDTSGTASAANVKLAKQGATNNQVLSWDDTAGKYIPKTPTSGSVTITSPNSTIVVGGTATNPTLDLAQQSAITGQALKWNGTKMAPTDEIKTYNPGGAVPTAQGWYYVSASCRVLNMNCIGATAPNPTTTTQIDSVFFKGDVFYCTGSGGYYLNDAEIHTTQTAQQGREVTNISIGTPLTNTAQPNNNGPVVFTSLVAFNSYINQRRLTMPVEVNFCPAVIGSSGYTATYPIVANTTEPSNGAVYLRHVDAINISLNGYDYTADIRTVNSCTVSGTVGNQTITYTSTTALSANYTVGTIIYIYNENNTNGTPTQNNYATTLNLGNHSGFYRITAVTSNTLTIVNYNIAYANVLSASDFINANIIPITAIGAALSFRSNGCFIGDIVAYFINTPAAQGTFILDIENSIINQVGVFGAAFEQIPSGTVYASSIITVSGSKINSWGGVSPGKEISFGVNTGNITGSNLDLFLVDIENSFINMPNYAIIPNSGNGANILLQTYNAKVSDSVLNSLAFIYLSIDVLNCDIILYNSYNCNVHSHPSLLDIQTTNRFTSYGIVVTNTSGVGFGETNAIVNVNGLYVSGNASGIYLKNTTCIIKTLYKLTIPNTANPNYAITCDIGSKLIIENYGFSGSPSGYLNGKLLVGLGCEVVLPNATPSFADTTKTVSLTGLPSSTKTFTVPATFITAIGGTNAINNYLIDTTSLQNLLITAVDTTNNIITVEQTYFSTGGNATFNFGIGYFDLSDWFIAQNNYGQTATNINAYIGGSVTPALEELDATVSAGAGSNVIPPSASGFMLAANKDGSGTAVPVTIIGGTYNPITQTLTITGGGSSTASFVANPSSGTAPLTLTLTDNSNPTPTSWLWTISPNTYTINSGSLTSSTLNVTLQNATAYTITMTPTKSGTTYQPTTASQTITPQAPAVINGDFTLSTTFSLEPNQKVVDYNNFASGDGIVVAANKLNAQTCASVTSSIITASNASPVPTVNVTTTNINNGTNSLSTSITNPVFPVSYTTTVVAVMNNSDGTTTTKTHNDVVKYYAAAKWQQTSSSTVPSFNGAGTNVVNDNYASGQSFTVGASATNIWIWVAVPINITTLNCYFNSTFGWGTSTPDVVAPQQTINGVVYSVFGYNQGGAITNAFAYYIDSHPTL